MFRQDQVLVDSEINAFLQALIEPLKKMHPQLPNIQFYGIFNRSFNAFTPGSFEIFFHTGLLEQVDTPEELAAVIFHELGHVVGHHLLKSTYERERTQFHFILPTVLALAAAGLTQKWALAPMGSVFGSLGSLCALTQHSRTQEHFADQFSVNALKHLGWSLKGFSDLMHKLSRKETRHAPLYTRTHPFSMERAKLIWDQKNTPQKTFPPSLRDQFLRCKIKTIAFCAPLEEAEAQLKALTVPHQNLKLYGNAIIAYRKGRTKEALLTLEQFQKNHSLGQDSFCLELKAQILFDAGQLKQALQAMNTALDLRPRDPFFLIFKCALALESEKTPLCAQKVIETLESVTILKPEYPDSWYIMALAYGRLGRRGHYLACMAEYFWALGDKDKAKQCVVLALKILSSSDLLGLKMKEMKEHIEKKDKK